MGLQEQLHAKTQELSRLQDHFAVMENAMSLAQVGGKGWEGWEGEGWEGVGGGALRVTREGGKVSGAMVRGWVRGGWWPPPPPPPTQVVNP